MTLQEMIQSIRDKLRTPELITVKEITNLLDVVDEIVRQRDKYIMDIIGVPYQGQDPSRDEIVKNDEKASKVIVADAVPVDEERVE